MLVELAAQPIYHDQPTMTTVMDLVMDDGFTAVAFEPLFHSSDGLRIVELDALFLRPPDAEPDWGRHAEPGPAPRRARGKGRRGNGRHAEGASPDSLSHAWHCLDRSSLCGGYREGRACRVAEPGARAHYRRP